MLGHSFLSSLKADDSVFGCILHFQMALRLSVPSLVIEHDALDLVCCQVPQFGFDLQINICSHLTTVATARYVMSSILEETAIIY